MRFLLDENPYPRALPIFFEVPATTSITSATSG
jgi:hypothetical protein